MLLSGVSSIAAGAVPLTGPAIVWVHGLISSALNPGTGHVESTDPVRPPLRDEQAGQVLEQTSQAPLYPRKRGCEQQARMCCPALCARTAGEMGIGCTQDPGGGSPLALSGREECPGSVLTGMALEERGLPLPTRFLSNLCRACSREIPFFFFPFPPTFRKKHIAQLTRVRHGCLRRASASAGIPGGGDMTR